MFLFGGTWIRFSLHVPLVRHSQHSLRLDQGAHQQARLAYQIVSQVVNKRPWLVAVVAHGIRFPSKILEVSKPKGFFSFTSFTHIFLGWHDWQFDKWSLPDFAKKLMKVSSSKPKERCTFALLKWPALGEARAFGSSRTTRCVWKLRRTKWTGDQLQGGLRSIKLVPLADVSDKTIWLVGLGSKSSSFSFSLRCLVAMVEDMVGWTDDTQDSFARVHQYSHNMSSSAGLISSKSSYPAANVYPSGNGWELIAINILPDISI